MLTKPTPWISLARRPSTNFFASLPGRSCGLEFIFETHWERPDCIVPTGKGNHTPYGLYLFHPTVFSERSMGEKAGHHQVQIWRTWCKMPGDERDAAEELGRDLAKDIEQEAAHENYVESTARLEGDGPRAGEQIPVKVDIAPSTQLSLYPSTQRKILGLDCASAPVWAIHAAPRLILFSSHTFPLFSLRNQSWTL